MLDMLETYLLPTNGSVVLHWFMGAPSEVCRASSLGCLFSVNAQMAKSERGRRVISEVPLERLLTETDGPFIQTAGHPMCPTDIHLAVRAIAEVRQTSEEVIAEAVRVNANRLLGASLRGLGQQA